MKDLSTPLETQIAARQSGFCEVYDIYLKSAISTPWGTISTLRLTDLPGGVSFFTPQLSPEPSGTQGDAQTYNYYPIKRDTVKSDAKFPTDKLQITASNVTTEFAAMVAAIDWYDTPIVIRKISTVIVTPTADDCAVIFSGEVDTISITEKTIVLECSNDLTTLQAYAPRENMHTGCRHQYGDDFCTAVKLRSTNTKAKTCGSSSTRTLVKSAGLTEDSGSNGSYGSELVNALSDGAITASSEGGALVTKSCTVGPEPVAGQTIYIFTTFTPADGTPVAFSASVLPTGLEAGKWYIAKNVTTGVGFSPFDPDDTENHYTITDYGSYLQYGGYGAGYIGYTDAGTSVVFTTIVASGSKASGVKTSKGVAYWGVGNFSDWGTESNGFLLIPGSQAGLGNMALKPWITFDFGTAKQIGLWRLQSVANSPLESLVRLVQLGYSSDNTNWVFHQYLELGPQGGQYYDFNIPTAPSKRYWRLCVRTRWGTSYATPLLSKVQAYIGSRNYWQSGRVIFDSGTATVALRGVAARVLQSYSGEVVVPLLPTAPANGDTFVIERGCPRNFNACSERGLEVNYGGFLELPYEAIVR